MKTGSPMQLDCSRVRFERGQLHTSRLDDKIVELRRLLCTDATLMEIGRQLGVSRVAVKKFVVKHRMCDLKERRRIINSKRLEPCE